MKKAFTIVLIFLVSNEGIGQANISADDKVYGLNYKKEIPFTLGMFVLNFAGFYKLGQKPALDSTEVFSLDQNDVWAFDRGVFSQSYPAPSGVYDISDFGLWFSYISPALLFLDKDISKDWKDITLLYLETQSINLNIYVWTAAFTKRVRPLVYIDDPENDFRFEETTTDSFFSGHASVTAGASFFIAKILNDYHPEWGLKRRWLFVAAVLPPAFVGYLRYRGFLHFPTDILIGTVVGAASGILGPHLHKITKGINRDMSFIPFTGSYSGTGLLLSMKF